MSGAKDFYSMQLVLRSITTTLGNFWEELATLSNNAISTEKEFDIKIDTKKAKGEKCPVCWKISQEPCERHGKTS